MKKPSLKTKMTILLPVAICIAMAMLLFATLHYFETTIKSTIATQQNLMVALLAEEMDQKLLSMQQPLMALTQKLTPRQLADRDEALAFLLERTEFTTVFDNGMFLFDSHGRMVAELPLGISRTGQDFSFREYLRITLSSRKPYISDPYISSKPHHHPAIMMTAPVLDSQGNVLAVLGGSIDLMQPNFLGKFDGIKIGNSGYMFMVSKNRKVIFHPDKKRILAQEVPKDSNRLIDKALAGYEGTQEVTNSYGVKMLTSVRHLKHKDWVLAANFPAEEAHAPLIRLQVFFAVSIIPALLLLFLAMRRLMGKMTEPILDLTRHVELLPGKTGADRLYEQPDPVEIATLSGAFNNLIKQLDHQQEELLKRETLYRTVIEFSSDIVYWVSADRKSLYYISPTCDKLTGYHEEEFYSNPDLLNQMVNSDHRLLWEQQCIEAEQNDCIEPVEYTLQTKEGVVIWVSHVCRRVYNENGDYRGTRGSFTDITLIKETEKARQASDDALHRQNHYLLALHETTLGLIGRLEIHGLLSAIINRAARLMGTEHGYIYLLDDASEHMVIQVQLGIFTSFEHHPLQKGEGMAGFVWETGESQYIDDYSAWKRRIADDPKRDAIHAMTGVPLTSGGEIIGVLGLAYLDQENKFDEEKMWHLERFAELASLALDNARLYEAAQHELRERTRAEKSLRMLTQAVEQSPVSVVITDTQGRIEYANPYFIQLTGYELHELQGRNPRILKSGFTGESEYRELWSTILAGNEWRGEFHNRKKNGELYWELALISPVRDETGTISHFISIKEDITDRKKLENELRHSQKMEAIGQLAGGIAHDFNNILTAIIGYASIMHMKASADTPFRTLTDQILATAERGASLTQGLLAFSRKQTSNPVPMNLNEIVRRVEKLLLRLIGEDMHLTFHLWPNKLAVMADSMQIEQVLMNLATNARDSMPEGGTITVKTELTALDARFTSTHGFGQPGEYALLTVSDTGTGMSEGTVKRIFEPFFTTKETGKGTGLGLSIVYGIVKKHNGYITCHSTVEKGTTFEIYLPLTSDQEQSKTVEPDPVSFTGGKELILLAEDDEASRDFSRELLEEFGYSVIEAEDGCAAVEKYRQFRQQIGLSILDMIMPGMKGLDVYREMKDMDPTAKVIFCSGYNLETLGDQGKELHFIAKPYTPKELLMKIREVLDAE